MSENTTAGDYSGDGTAGARNATEIVGRVIGTEDSTPLEFWVAVAPGQHLQLDDVVALERVLPTGEIVKVFGIVGDVRARHEGAKFDSDVFLIADGVLPAQVSEAALIQPTRFLPETLVPPLPGAAVRKATDDERDMALDFDEVDRKLPGGLSRDNEMIWLDLDFIDGSKGAHINISGISGVATKTSYATFLLYSLFNSGALGAEATNTKALIFNVKGEDLLFLDHPNIELDEANRLRYAALGLPAEPFGDVGILAPPRKGDPNATPATGSRQKGVSPFFWTIEEFCRDALLPFLFADAGDERQQYTIVVQAVTAQLQKVAKTSGDSSGSVTIDGTKVTTFSGLIDAIEEKLLPEDDDYADQSWTGRSVGTGTIGAFIRRLASAKPHVEQLIRADVANASSHKLDLDKAQVTVGDIHSLHDRAKRFVVGVTLRRAFDAKEASGVAKPLQFIVLDELNKYAPRDSSSPIKEILLDVAERGRSLGIILIGAQQTASEVERRVVANSAIRVVGRLDSAEARRDEYGFLPAVQRARSTILKPGSMYVAQPRLPVPLLTEFPFPAWATRSAEAGKADNPAGSENQPDDPFEGL